MTDLVGQVKRLLPAIGNKEVESLLENLAVGVQKKNDEIERLRVIIDGMEKADAVKLDLYQKSLEEKTRLRAENERLIHDHNRIAGAIITKKYKQALAIAIRNVPDKDQALSPQE